MSIAEIPQLKALTADEKLQLIDELWCSIDLAEISASAKLIAELERRIAEHEANPEAGLTLEEFKRRYAEMHP